MAELYKCKSTLFLDSPCIFVKQSFAIIVLSLNISVTAYDHIWYHNLISIYMSKWCLTYRYTFNFQHFTEISMVFSKLNIEISNNTHS